MHLAQRVVRRNGLFSRFLLFLVGIALFLLVHAIIYQNLANPDKSFWFWRFQLMDVQSATATLLATIGAFLARAQYARSVRPVIGYSCWTVEGLAPGGLLAVRCRVVNGAQDVATITEVRYNLLFTERVQLDGCEDITEWVDHEEVVAALAALELTNGEEFFLQSVGPGRPLPSQGRLNLGWITKKGMDKVAEIYVRLRVEDRVGDTHERVIVFLKGMDRDPKHADLDPWD